ncbi:ParB/RepB/Spo0J family partition protein [Duncaniella dubosii]|uniref:ParB/RepB/Spo0J family partition protein n=1 Tax=Duncaniella dubosii TaxID=2518971 RepID=UPI000F51A7E7|nr:ParB/RepB/Spo0J family partition protein [Duncaniella dubosii]MCX4285036.1 ParB/RepB/Spo0J family partition protein [Duncaniella dubosii]ROS83735.1 ParB/RepB/Spo0J family partition protein [Muribaculaceae bacterium Isolate-036 (Harlan)]
MSELNSTKRTDIYTIDPRNVVIVENFNVRKEFALDELKEQIKLQGVLNPITVVPFKDEDGNEKYRLVDGERRVRATLAAIEEGAEIARIKAIFLPRNTKEEDLLIEQMMRNEGKNFTEYEQALMFQRFRDKFGYSQSEIAAKFGKSATFIGRCLSLLELAPEIQEKIENGEISTGAVRQIVGTNKEDEAAQIEAVETAIADAKSKGKSTATAKNVSGETKALRSLKKVVDSLLLLFSTADQMEKPIREVNAYELISALQTSTSLEEAITKLSSEK